MKMFTYFSMRKKEYTTKTCPCDVQRFFSSVKIEKSEKNREKMFLLKTLIVGTHNLYFVLWLCLCVMLLIKPVHTGLS